MSIWWDGLSNFQHIMFMIAVPATLLLLIFLVLMLIGMEGSNAFGDTDASGIDFHGDSGGVDFHGDSGVDFHGDAINHDPVLSFSGLRILTLRGALTFFGIGGWVAFILDGSIPSVYAGLIGLVCGLVAAILLAWAFQAMMKLESVGNLNYSNAIGKVGSVYIRVPKNHSGKGKVTLNLQDKYIEADAVTDDDEDLTTHTVVNIIGIENETTLVVTRKSK